QAAAATQRCRSLHREKPGAASRVCDRHVQPRRLLVEGRGPHLEANRRAGRSEMKLRLALAFGAVAVVAAAAGIYFSLGEPDSGKGGMPFGRTMTPKQIPALEFEDGPRRARALAGFKGKPALP